VTIVPGCGRLAGRKASALECVFVSLPTQRGERIKTLSSGLVAVVRDPSDRHRTGGVGLVVVSSAGGGWLAQTLSGTAGAGFAPEGYGPRGQPARILDTRGDPGVPVGRGQTVEVQTGQAGSDAVAVDIAPTETAGAGFLTAWDCGRPRPITAVINSSAPAETISNFVIVPINGSGTFCLYANSSTHVVVDLMGAFTSDAGGG
jgi:hypothetical protein